MKSLNFVWLLLLALSLVFPACEAERQKKVPVTPKMGLERLSPKDYPAFMDSLDFRGFSHALDHSLTYFKKLPPQRKFRFGGDEFTAAHMIRSLEVLKIHLANGPTTAALNKFIKARYRVYGSVVNGGPGVLFTGYFEPVYAGSLIQDPAYPYPLYTQPSDMVTVDLSLFGKKYGKLGTLRGRLEEDRLLPYLSRAQINKDPGFAKRARPLIWLANRVDRFFLEVQGSGRIRLPGGSEVLVHYAGSNGREYKSIGRRLIESGEIPREKMSMQAIREWLSAHPDRMDDILHHNPSFVFFKRENAGPFGCLGVPVTPVRSIATDTKVFPRGALCFLRTSLPDVADLRTADHGKKTLGPHRDDWESVSLFAMNQDTGGAIKGPGRADLFCGSGAWAEFAAGNMNVRGRLYFLVLEPGSLPPK